MTDLSPGANAPLPTTSPVLTVTLPAGAEIDVSAMQLYAGGKVRGDGDMCFFNQPSIGDGAIAMSRPSPTEARFALELDRVASEVEKIVVIATVDGARTFGDLGDVRIHTGDGPAATIPAAGRSEAALILAEIYRRNGQWKMRNVGQGFNGGLEALATHFGVEIAAPAPASAPTVDTTRPSEKKPSGPSLDKVSLTKENATVSLEKRDGRFGKMRVNLNWDQRPRRGGMLGLQSRAIDLDLGALVEDIHGNRTVVQALGNAMGDYRYFPYVQLLGDDRTGAVSDGEWLEINGDMWPELNRVLVFAFIYEGAVDWADAGGVIRLEIPGQPEVEVRMNEYENTRTMCAVAMLANVDGRVKVDREVTFHRGHRYMDDAYDWGLRWAAGRK